MESEKRNQQRGNERRKDARNLLRQFKNVGNYLRLLFDPDVYGLCKLYAVIRCLTAASSYTLRRESSSFRSPESLRSFCDIVTDPIRA